MADYQLTRKAVEDLSDIWFYTCDTWSEKQADLYYQMLIDCFGVIALRPESGKSYSVILNELKGYRTGRHIIFYRKLPDQKIEIIRILHEQMDLKNRIREK